MKDLYNVPTLDIIKLDPNDANVASGAKEGNEPGIDTPIIFF